MDKQDFDSPDLWEDPIGGSPHSVPELGFGDPPLSSVFETARLAESLGLRLLLGYRRPSPSFPPPQRRELGGWRSVNRFRVADAFRVSASKTSPDGLSFLAEGFAACSKLLSSMAAGVLPEPLPPGLVVRGGETGVLVAVTDPVGPDGMDGWRIIESAPLTMDNILGEAVSVANRIVGGCFAGVFWRRVGILPGGIARTDLLPAFPLLEGGLVPGRREALEAFLVSCDCRVPDGAARQPRL